MPGNIDKFHFVCSGDFFGDAVKRVNFPGYLYPAPASRIRQVGSGKGAYTPVRNGKYEGPGWLSPGKLDSLPEQIFELPGIFLRGPAPVLIIDPDQEADKIIGWQ